VLDLAVVRREHRRCEAQLNLVGSVHLAESNVGRHSTQVWSVSSATTADGRRGTSGAREEQPGRQDQEGSPQTTSHRSLLDLRATSRSHDVVVSVNALSEGGNPGTDCLTSARITACKVKKTNRISQLFRLSTAVSTRNNRKQCSANVMVCSMEVSKEQVEGTNESKLLSGFKKGGK